MQPDAEIFEVFRTRNLTLLVQAVATFIPQFSEKAAPLHALKWKEATWTWMEECQSSFELIKHELTSASVLITQDLSKPFRVQTDASDMEAVLTQNIDGVEHCLLLTSITGR